MISAGDRGHAYVTLADVFVAVGDTERARALSRPGLDLLVEHGKPRVIEAGRSSPTCSRREGTPPVRCACSAGVRRRNAAATGPDLAASGGDGGRGSARRR